jgi:hypothetical protein
VPCRLFLPSHRTTDLLELPETVRVHVLHARKTYYLAMIYATYDDFGQNIKLQTYESFELRMVDCKVAVARPWSTPQQKLSASSWKIRILKVIDCSGINLTLSELL